MESRKNNMIFFSSGMLDPSPKLNIPRQSSVREPQLTLEENDGYRGPWAGKCDNERAIVMYFWHTLRTVQGANCIEVLSYSMVTQSFWKLTKVSLFGRETLFLEKKMHSCCPLKLPQTLSWIRSNHMDCSHKSSYLYCQTLTCVSVAPGLNSRKNDGSCFPFAPGNLWFRVTCSATYRGSHSD